MPVLRRAGDHSTVALLYHIARARKSRNRGVNVHFDQATSAVHGIISGDWWSRFSNEVPTEAADETEFDVCTMNKR